MGWREDYKLSDLPDEADIEVQCRKCKQHRYELGADLKAIKAFDGQFMIDVQGRLRCTDKHCDGPQRLAIIHDHLNQGFVGGMP